MTQQDKLRKAILEEQAAKGELAARNFRYFVQQAWPILEPTTPYVEGIHHAAMCEHLQAVTDGQIRKLIINTPPRFGKSIIVSIFWPMWVWIRYPESRFLCTSFSTNLAWDFSIKAQKVIKSEWYQQNWGDIIQLDRETIEVFDNTRSGSRRCCAYQNAMGFGASGHGALILDDPHNVSEVLSDEVRAKDLQIYDQGLSNRISAGASIILVCQRLHQDDLTGHLLERNLGFDHLVLPNEYDSFTHKVTSIGWSDPRAEQGDGALLWPQIFDEKATEERKLSLGSLAYQGQYQQQPVAKTGGMVNPDWFREWNQHNLPTEWDEHVISCDLSFKGGKQNDYVVFQYWARSKAEFYLIDQYRKQMDFVQTVDAFQMFCAKYPHVTTKLIEDKANGPAIISMLRKVVSGIIAVDPGKNSKESRLSAVSPMIEAGNVYIPEKATWKEDFLKEVMLFPRAKNDDVVDAMTQALLKMEKCRKRTIQFITTSIM